MKVTKVKAFTTALVLITGMSFSSIVLADEIEVTLPVIARPAVLDEGTQRVLSEEQVAELLPWAKDSKVFLNDLLTSLEGLTSQDKVDQLILGITSVVGDSAPKNSELLMRYVLNRGLAINEILNDEMDAEAAGSVDAKIRVLTASVNMAIKYYDTDMAMMSKKTSAPLAQFGNDYFRFLTELNKSVFDASAQYSISRTSLEWFQWDLYRDLNNRSFASQIVKVNNSLKLYPNKKLSDAQSIAFIRQMKAVSAAVDVQNVITKMKNDELMAAQRILNEQNEIVRQKADEQAAILKKAKAEQDALNQKRKLEQDELDRKNRDEELLKKFGPVIETTQIFVAPKINSISFSDQSSNDGVCIALGYQRALAKKSDLLRLKESLVIVDADGNFTGVKRTTGGTYDNTKYVTSITCFNKLVSKKNVQVDIVSSFSFVNEMNISSNSHVNGVCKLLGYEKGLDGSVVKGEVVKDAMPVIEENGNTVAIDTSSKPTLLKELICVNKKTSYKTLALIKVEHPNVDGNLFSKNSNAQGICKKIGYSKALDGIRLGTTKLAFTAMVADVTGEIVNTEYVAVNSLFVSNVICVK